MNVSRGSHGVDRNAPEVECSSNCGVVVGLRHRLADDRQERLAQGRGDGEAGGGELWALGARVDGFTYQQALSVGLAQLPLTNPRRNNRDMLTGGQVPPAQAKRTRGCPSGRCLIVRHGADANSER